MAEIDCVSKIEFVRRSVRIASSLGMYLQIGSDFNAFCRMATKHGNQKLIDPIFDPRQSDIGPKNGFWVIGCDRNGELVHTQAIRLIELGTSSFGEYLSSNLATFRPNGLAVDTEKSDWRLSPNAAAISGSVSYHGGLWVKGGQDGFRGGCLTAVLTRFMLAICLLKWRPDFLIGFQAPHTMCRGLAAREGYMRTEQRTILWRQSNLDVLLEDWLVWMSQEEAEFNLSVPPELFYELYEGRQESELSNKQPMLKSA